MPPDYQARSIVNASLCQEKNDTHLVLVASEGKGKKKESHPDDCNRSSICYTSTVPSPLTSKRRDNIFPLPLDLETAFIHILDHFVDSLSNLKVSAFTLFEDFDDQFS